VSIDDWFCDLCLVKKLKNITFSKKENFLFRLCFVPWTHEENGRTQFGAHPNYLNGIRIIKQAQTWNLQTLSKKVIAFVTQNKAHPHSTSK
jgi:hypothetical protein